MSPGFVRFGGISAFLALAVLIIGIFVVGAMAAGAIDTRTGQVSPDAISPIPGIIVNVLVTFFLIVSLLASKGLFNAMGYRGGDVPIYLVVGATIVILVLGFAGGSGLTSMSATQTGGSVIGTVSLILLLVLFLGFTWFSITCITFGGRAKMGIWKAIGILFLIVGACLTIMMLIVLIIALTASSGGRVDPTAGAGMAGLIGILFLIGGLVWIAAMICHGIGLLIGAGRMGGRPA